MFFGCFQKLVGLGLLPRAGRPVGQPTTDDCQYNLLSVSAQPLRIGKICRQSSACEGVYRHPSGNWGLLGASDEWQQVPVES